MLAYHRTRRNVRALLCLMLLAAVMAACASTHEVIYHCEGSAEAVAVTYLGQGGDRLEETVSLPWEVTLEFRGSSVRTDLTAENLGDSGTITCAAVVDGSQADASGEASVSITGSSSFRGDDNTHSFSSFGEARTGFNLNNLGSDPACRFHVTPSGEDWGVNLLEGGPLEGGQSRFVAFDFEEREYDFRVQFCDGALDFLTRDTIEDTNRTLEFGFGVSGSNPEMTVANTGGGDVCGLYLQLDSDVWTANFLDEGERLASGASRTIRTRVADQSFRAEPCEGEPVEVLDLSVLRGDRISWILADDPSLDRYVLVLNETDQPLCDVYFTSDTESWGENRVADYPIPPGGLALIPYAYGAEVYDLKTNFCDGTLNGFLLVVEIDPAAPEGGADIHGSEQFSMNPIEDSPALTFVNGGSKDICEFNFTLDGETYRNLLSDGQRVAPGEEWVVYLFDATLSFGMTTCDGNLVESPASDFSTGDKTLTYHD